MLIPFIKMQAQGNDFVIWDQSQTEITDISYPDLARSICRLHFGVGADGLVLLSKGTSTDLQMLIYNSDGSRAEMCGSALRCISSFYCQKTGLKQVSVLTDSGIHHAVLNHASQSMNVEVSMGTPKILEADIEVAGFVGTLVDVGNLHFVVFGHAPDINPHLLYGSILEHDPHFPKAVNVHFATVVSPHLLQIQIWEAACGATLACGTGATASVACGLAKGLLANGVEVIMPGGRVTIQTKDDVYWLGGSVETVFEGIYTWNT